jgi:glycosyltransferase involved in cell wall biosynthesis
MKTMTKNNSTSSHQPTRVLFLAWGYSIHAERRISCFAEDESFEVCIVSTYGYTIPGAKTINLRNAKTSIISVKEQSSLKQMKYFCSNLIQKATGITFSKGIYRFLKPISEPFWTIRDFQAIRRAVFKFKPDVVFLQTLLYPCYLGLFLNSNIKTIVTFWNGDVLWWAKYSGIERIFKKQIVKRGAQRAVAISVNSESAKDACLNYGAEKEKIHIIRYPGVDRTRFRPSSKEIARKNIGISAEKVVLCPRGLGAYLNSDVIVKAAHTVIKKYPDTLFLFISGVGGETELARHQHMARELGIENNFRWEGQVPWNEVPNYYAVSDAMVSISSNDSLPNCMLEAMACKIPVIMGDIPQIREWVTDDVNGFLVPPRDSFELANAISKVFENKDGFIYSFVSKNLERISQDADSRINIKRVKDLVHYVAFTEDFSSHN